MQGRIFVLFAGLLWSLGGPLIRLLENASEWQFLFYRSIALATALLLAIKLQNSDTLSLFKNSGKSGFIGGFFLSLAFVFFVFSITNTTIANSLFMLSSAPFMAGFLGWIILREKISKTQLTSMIIALIGVAVMIQGGISGDSLFGNITAFIAALGFAGFTVSLRWGKNKNMLPTVCYAGLYTILFCTIAFLFVNEGPIISWYDFSIATGFGGLGLGLGMIFYVAGSNKIQASELVFLTLLEIVLGPIWAWMYFSERPATPTLIGGFILLSAILFQTLVGSKLKDDVQTVSL